LPDGGVVLCKVAEGSEPVLSRTARCRFVCRLRRGAPLTENARLV
jgi:hypothetical protein